MRSKIITAEIEQKLIANGQAAARGEDTAFARPVLKLFTPWGANTWLITERDPDEPDLLFGLCDLGHGCPELGRVSLSELLAVRGRFGLGIERDRHFKATKTLEEYAHEAREKGRIIA